MCGTGLHGVTTFQPFQWINELCERFIDEESAGLVFQAVKEALGAPSARRTAGPVQVALPPLYRGMSPRLVPHASTIATSSALL